MPSTPGTCMFCKTKINTINAIRHFSKCNNINKVLKGNIDGYLIKIKDKYSAYYWLYVAVPSDYTLEDLDKFIRDIWVECCGHLSEFRIGNVFYSSDYAPDPFLFISGDEKSMKVKLSDILKNGLEFEYTYDFGDSTELKLQVIKDIKMNEKCIYILGRNDNPISKYENSGKYIPNSPRIGICAYTGNKKLEEVKIWKLGG